MKKFIFVVFIAVFSVAAVFASTEEIDVYAYLYNTSLTNTAQLDILRHMSAARLVGAGEFYARALRRLVSEHTNITSVTERNAAIEQAVILSSLLGAEKYSPAAIDLWRLVDEFEDPLVKAEAMMALGKIRAPLYLPRVIRVLNDLNTTPTPDRLRGERIAFGAIIALEKYQDPSGYLPVFFASQGWYSNRIKDQARKSLPFISQDPTEYMMEVVRGTSHNYPTKFAALQAMEASDADTKNKADVAVAALSEGWRASTVDRQLQTTLSEMRKLALSMINRYKTDDEAVYPLLEQSYTNHRVADPQERLTAIATLASLGTEEAARRLSSFLMVLNSRRQSNALTREEETFARAIIPALGQTRQAIGRPALNAVGSLDWTPAIKRLAQDALRQIN